MNVAAVVLAAGSSRRLGRPKQTVEIGGETLLGRAVRVAREARLQPVIVVLRQGVEFADAFGEEGAVVVCNNEADEGIASSIRCGVRAAAEHGAGGVVLTTCDQPGVRPEHLRALLEDESAIAGSAYDDRVGVPAYFPASAFESLLGLRGDVGARELLQGARSIRAERLGVDVDTEEDVERARMLLEGNAEKL